MSTRRYSTQRPGKKLPCQLKIMALKREISLRQAKLCVIVCVCDSTPLWLAGCVERRLTKSLNNPIIACLTLRMFLWQWWGDCWCVTGGPVQFCGIPQSSTLISPKVEQLRMCLWMSELWFIIGVLCAFDSQSWQRVWRGKHHVSLGMTECVIITYGVVLWLSG